MAVTIPIHFFRRRVHGLAFNRNVRQSFRHSSCRTRIISQMNCPTSNIFTRRPCFRQKEFHVKQKKKEPAYFISSVASRASDDRHVLHSRASCLNDARETVISFNSNLSQQQAAAVGWFPQLQTKQKRGHTHVRAHTHIHRRTHPVVATQCTLAQPVNGLCVVTQPFPLGALVVEGLDVLRERNARFVGDLA